MRPAGRVGSEAEESVAMFSNRLYSHLRYPGGKAPFAPFIAKVMEENGVTGGHYLEPYAGGAGVALDLLSMVMLVISISTMPTLRCTLSGFQ